MTPPGDEGDDAEDDIFTTSFEDAAMSVEEGRGFNSQTDWSLKCWKRGEVVVVLGGEGVGGGEGDF